MVLSNKKLKQKLREALAQKAASAVGTPITQTKTTTDGAKVPAKALPLNSKEVNGETSRDIQGLLDSAAKGRQSLSKREKRRKLRELSNVGGIKGAQQDATPSKTNKEQSLEDESNKQKKKRKLEKEKNNGVLVENKGAHLENGHDEGSESNKKKKRRKGEDKDMQIEDKGALMQEREDDKGTHLENGHPESRKSKTKKKKEGKKEGKDGQIKDENTRLENGNAGDIKSKKKKKKKKGKNKSEQSASDGLALSSAADAAEDIVINANEGTLPQSQESNYDESKVYVGGIPYYSNEDDIRSFFEGCGTVTEVDCMTFPGPHSLRVNEVEIQTKISSKAERSTYALTDIDHNGHCSFLELPPVLISEILNHLNARELSIVSCVCVLFRRISSDSHGWKEFYCERWGLPAHRKPSETSAMPPEKSWRELYLEREARSKAFLGRFKIDVFHGHTEPIRSVCLLAFANLIFTAGYDTMIRMWNMEEGFLIEQSRPLRSTIRAIAADMEMLVVGGTEAFVRGWRAIPELPHLFDISGITGQNTEFCLRGHVGPITCLGLDSARIYSGSWDMSIRVWDRASLKCLKILRHGDWVWSLVVRGPHLMSAAGSDIYTWDIETGHQMRVRLNAHVGNAYSLACSRSGHLLFTGGEDGAIHMFEDRAPRHHTSHSDVDVIVNDKPVASWVPHSCPVYSLAFEDPWLVSASGDGKLAMMDVRKLLKSSSNFKSEKAANSRQWKNTAIVTLQNVEPPQRLLHGFYQNLYSVDIGAERIVCGGEEGVLRMWDFTQALEIERRVQASRNVRLENRSRRKKVNAENDNKAKQVDPCSIAAKSCERHGGGNRVWKRRDESGKVQA